MESKDIVVSLRPEHLKTIKWSLRSHIKRFNHRADRLRRQGKLEESREAAQLADDCFKSLQELK